MLVRSRFKFFLVQTPRGIERTAFLEKNTIVCSVGIFKLRVQISFKAVNFNLGVFWGGNDAKLFLVIRLSN